MMNPQEFQVRCNRLYDRARSGQWDPKVELPRADVDFDRATLSSPLISTALGAAWPGLPSETRREQFRLCMGTLLTNLAYGEHYVVGASDHLADCMPTPVLRNLEAMQRIDEARHEKVLFDYVGDQLGFDVLPTRCVAARNLSEGTQRAGDSWRANTLLVMILEIAALASLQGMRAFCQEPLAQRMLRKVVSDESRHISALSLALRCPDTGIDEEERQRLQDVTVLGWTQGLLVTERPVLNVSRLLDGEDELTDEDLRHAPPGAWLFFRQMIAATMLPKLKLAGIYDEALEHRLVAAGCPITADPHTDSMD